MSTGATANTVPIRKAATHTSLTVAVFASVTHPTTDILQGFETKTPLPESGVFICDKQISNPGNPVR
jgi:hypothetical protein